MSCHMHFLKLSTNFSSYDMCVEKVLLAFTMAIHMLLCAYLLRKKRSMLNTEKITIKSLSNL